MSKEEHPVVHFEIGCRNLVKTKDFYQKVFGWHMTQNGPSTHIATNSASGIQGHMTALGHEPHNYVNIYIQVEDLNGCLGRIQHEGGRSLIGPIQLPDGTYFAWFQDVAGNTIGLITKK